jgi:serine/threonine protein kinase
MAQVFLAVQRGAFASNKLVVIKKLLPGAGADQQVTDMFLDEARIAMRLNHPNVVTTFDFVAEEDELYLTMEFLDGQSLLQTLRGLGRDKVPLDLHIWILTQVLAGLGYAHELRDFDGRPLGIVHRDVTPSNVILTYAGAVKLVDFGIAKVAGAVSVTQTGTMKGKIGYASPEQCLGKPTTAGSDLFSVGIMLWEAIAGKRRTVGETPAAVYQARIAGTERSIEEVLPNVPEPLAKIVKRALATDPENRYGKASEFQRDLEEYLDARSHASFGTNVLADFMKLHFGETMAAMHRTIETRIAEPPFELTPNGLPGREPTTSSTGPRPTSNPSQPDAAVTPAPPASVQPTRPPVRAVAIGGAAALLGLVMVVALRGRHPTPSSAAAMTAPTGAPRSAPAAVPTSAPPSPPAQPPAPTPGSTPAAPSVTDAAGEELADARPNKARPRTRKRVGVPNGLTTSEESTARPRPPLRAPGPAAAMAVKAPAAKVEPAEVEETPGMDLPRRSSPRGSGRHIDERYPYTP